MKTEPLTEIICVGDQLLKERLPVGYLLSVMGIYVMGLGHTAFNLPVEVFNRGLQITEQPFS